MYELLLHEYNIDPKISMYTVNYITSLKCNKVYVAIRSLLLFTINTKLHYFSKNANICV